jgi:hypothetical protein
VRKGNIEKTSKIICVVILIIWAKVAIFQTYQVFFRRAEDSSSKQRTLIDVIMQFLLALAH